MAMEKRSPSWFTTRTTGSMKVGALNSGEDSSSGISEAADAEKPAKRTMSPLTLISVSQVWSGIARDISSTMRTTGTVPFFSSRTAPIWAILASRAESTARSSRTWLSAASSWAAT